MLAGGTRGGRNRTTPAPGQRRHWHVLIEQPHDQRSVFHTDLDEDLPVGRLAEKPIDPWLRGERGGR